jgi:hypothetical protein
VANVRLHCLWQGIKLSGCGAMVHKTCLLRAITNPIGIYHMWVHHYVFTETHIQ